MRPQKLSHPEIEQRLPVWTILSELFLDTSFDDADYDRIAAILNQSPYSQAEIERILATEDSPAFSSNMFQIAGEWIRWNEDEVREIMTSSLEKRAAPGWLSAIKRTASLKIFPSGWPSVAKRLRADRKRL